MWIENLWGRLARSVDRKTKLLNIWEDLLMAEKTSDPNQSYKTRMSNDSLHVSDKQTKYFLWSNEPDLTFSHHTLHGVRLSCGILLHRIHKTGKIRLEIPVKLHHVARQVISSSSVHHGKTVQRPHKHPIAGFMNPLSQQRQQRCMERNTQSSPWAHVLGRLMTNSSSGRAGEPYILSPTPFHV